MARTEFSNNRRRFLQMSAYGAAMFSAQGLFAEELVQTPTVGEGPFYPDKLPLDTDNDLLILNDAITPAVGEITHLAGRILTATGAPIRNAFVEIWQVDNKGSYIHTGGAAKDGRDGNFQGYGRFLTNSKGEYYFRTIKPVPYAVGSISRTPHIRLWRQQERPPHLHDADVDQRPCDERVGWLVPQRPRSAGPQIDPGRLPSNQGFEAR